LPLVTEPTFQWTAERQLVADLYSEIRKGVYQYLLTLGMDADRAQEFTQEAFLRLFQKLRDGATIENPRGWVYRVAHNMAVDALSARSRESELSDALLSTLVSGGKDAEQVLIEREWLEGFQNAVKGLSQQQRRCLELRAQGLRYREIAEVLRVGTPTVGEFLRRATKHLRGLKNGKDRTPE
jgi:RNA polymerase sigma-70 factor (ECF subfamily)